jgi:hypothetical protein
MLTLLKHVNICKIEELVAWLVVDKRELELTLEGKRSWI